MKVQLGVSMYYFFIAVPLSIIGGFVPVYMREIGFTDSQVGIVVGAAALTGTIFTTIWGAIDDKHQKSSLLLMTTAIAAGVAFFFLGIFKTFIVFLGIRIIYDTLMCGNWPLVDKSALQAQEHYRIPYAYMRVLGSIGFAVILIPTMYLVDVFNSNMVAFVLGTIGCFVAAASTFLFRDLDKKNQAAMKVKQAQLAAQAKAAGTPEKTGGDLKKLFTTVPFLLLMVSYMFTMSSNEVAGAFQGIHLTQTLGAPKFAISLMTLMMAGISEVPMFLVSAKITEKFGWYTCALIALSAFFLRFILESQFTYWPFFIAGKMLHGICISMSTAPFFMLVRKHVADNVYSRAITLLTSMRSLLTTGLSMAVGRLIDTTGSTFSMYYVFLVTMSISIAIYLYYGSKYEKGNKPKWRFKRA